MPLHRSILFSVAVASLAMAILAPSAALAFACYVGEAPTGPVILRAQPDDKAKIAARLEQFNMVGDISGVRERNGWIYVRWSKTQTSQREFNRGKGYGKGWMKREEIRGECED